MHREIVDALQPGYRPVGTPTHQAFLFATWTPVDRLSITPNLEYANDRWSDITGGGYVRVGEYVLLNLQVQFQATSHMALSFGGRNLLDRNFELADGFPEPGRTLFAKVQASF